jgi:hypothetical protein
MSNRKPTPRERHHARRLRRRYPHLTCSVEFFDDEDSSPYVSALEYFTGSEIDLVHAGLINGAVLAWLRAIKQDGRHRLVTDEFGMAPLAYQGADGRVTLVCRHAREGAEEPRGMHGVGSEGSGSSSRDRRCSHERRRLAVRRPLPAQPVMLPGNDVRH